MSRLNRPTASQWDRNQLLRNRANRENIEYADMEKVEYSETAWAKGNCISQGCIAEPKYCVS